MSLENQVIAITGAGSGIGRATAIYLADVGARVGLLDIRAPDSVAEAIEQKHGKGRAVAFACNVRDSAEVDQAFDSIVAAFGPLNGSSHSLVEWPTADESRQAQ